MAQLIAFKVNKSNAEGSKAMLQSLCVLCQSNQLKYN